MHTRTSVYALLLTVVGSLLCALRVLKFPSAQRLTAPPFEGGQVIYPKRRVLLWTQVRSGSRLTQGLLMAPPCAFHSEEPLRGRAEAGVNASLHLLSDILQCRFARHPDYFERWMNGSQVNEYRVKRLCMDYIRLCQDAALTEALCRGACLSLVRVVALDLNAATPLLQDRGLGARVVHLVRDPRAVVASRMQMDLRTTDGETKSLFTDEERNLTGTCARYRRDLVAGRSLALHDPHRYTLVRYEDLALRPQAEVRRLYAFMDLPYTALVAHNVAKLTLGVWSGSNLSHPFETYRNSTATVFGWRGRLPFKEVERIQQECGDVLQAYGYRLFTSRQDYENRESDAVMPLRDDLWGHVTSTPAMSTSD